MRRRALGILNAVVIICGLAGVVIGVATVAGAVVIYAPVLEGSLAPVVEGWRAEATREAGGATNLRIRATKIRSCKYLHEDMSVENASGEARDVASAWIDDPTPNSTRRTGKQDFGVLRVFTDRATAAGSPIIGMAHHSCHPMWDTLTPIAGPGFVVPPLPTE